MSDDAVLGVILAGGLARRMGGGDKALLTLGGRTLLDHVSGRFGPQCAAGLILSANGDPARFRMPELTIVADAGEGGAGPLAGLLAALDWAARHRPGCGMVASVTVDAPFLPGDLVARLLAVRARSGRAVTIARSGGRDHPAHAIWPVAARDALRRAIEGGARGAGAFAASQGYGVATWPADPRDPFVNLNTPAELAEAELMLAQAAGDAAAVPGTHRLDLRGLKCPLPALKTAKALRGLASGTVLEVACTDPMAAIDIPNLVRETGARLAHQGVLPDGTLEFRIVKG